MSQMVYEMGSHSGGDLQSGYCWIFESPHRGENCCKRISVHYKSMVIPFQKLKHETYPSRFQRYDIIQGK